MERQTWQAVSCYTVHFVHLHIYDIVQTNITCHYDAAKFNCTVPGTLYNKSDDCPDTVTNAPHSIHSNKEPPITANPQATFSDTKDKTATEMIADSTTSQSRNSSRKTLILATGLGGVISVILVLLCLCVCVCCVLICRRQRMKGIKMLLMLHPPTCNSLDCILFFFIVSAITSAEMERRISTVSKQVEAANGKGKTITI